MSSVTHLHISFIVTFKVAKSRSEYPTIENTWKLKPLKYAEVGVLADGLLHG